ncbi:MAG: S-layer homology domain-containing protein, partial [Nanoarchaeota archaeon]
MKKEGRKRKKVDVGIYITAVLSIVLFSALLYAFALSIPFTGRAATFSDVPESYWAFKEIEALYREGITIGCDESPLRFCPTDATLRDQFAVFLVRAMKLAPYDKATPTFEDVRRTYWAYKEIEGVYRAGITQGCSYDAATGKRYFCPGNSVSRTQSALFIQRALNITPYNNPVPAFVDVPKTHQFYKEIEAIYKEGITQGCLYYESTNERYFCPNDIMLRDQMAVFLVKAFKIPVETQQPKPDLVVSDINIVDEQGSTYLVGGKNFIVSVKVKNIGTADSDVTFFYKVYVDGTQAVSMSCNNFPRISIGQEITCSTFRLTSESNFAGQGIHNVRAVIDTSNLVSELKEDNNELTKVFTVSPSQPTTQTCSDGTPISSCSSTRPYYCNSVGGLVANCFACGCPTGMVCQS